jgi:hypothetical protein
MSVSTDPTHPFYNPAAVQKAKEEAAEAETWREFARHDSRSSEPFDEAKDDRASQKDKPPVP